MPAAPLSPIKDTPLTPSKERETPKNKGKIFVTVVFRNREGG